MQKLTDQQRVAFDQSIPALGTHGSGRSAGDIINSLFLLGGAIVPYVSNATVNTKDTVPHGLGYVPKGYIVIGSDKAAVIYNDGTAWTDVNLFLKCDTVTTTATLLVF
jgi:hypothetical protein